MPIPAGLRHLFRGQRVVKSEQQRAMRELVTGEYWRLVAARNVPHKEPIAS